MADTYNMWMGPRGGEIWVPPAQSGSEFPLVGWGSTRQYLNGGAGRRRSRMTHREYPLTWGLHPRDTLAPIADMYNGLLGDGLIYWINPFAADRNNLPIDWSAPFMACEDAIPLIGKKRPTKVLTPTNAFRYPKYSASYDLTGTPVSRTLYIPIPPGFTAWVGAHGSVPSGTGGVAVTAILPGDLDGATTTLPWLSVNSSTRYSTSFVGGTNQGIELSIAKGTSTSMILSGLMVTMLPTGDPVETGSFISGRGHSGCEFDEAPSEVAFNAALDLVGMTTTLIEVGSWL